MLGESNGVFVAAPSSENPRAEYGVAPQSNTANKGAIPFATVCNTYESYIVCNMPDLTQMAAKIDSLKKWTVSTFKTTKQSICENLGKVERTVDKELEDQIEALKDLHRRYNQVLEMSKIFNMYFHQMSETQKGLAESLYQLSLRETALTKECASNSDSLRTISHNGELLEKALNFYLSSLQTLCEKTIEDTMFTIHSHDQARLEYDVHRNELSSLREQANITADAIAVAEQRCQTHKERYEQLKQDVKVKLTLLEENRIKVMRKQLVLFHNALMAYFSGNAKALQSKMEELGVDNLEGSDCVAPSFLEQ